MLRRLVQYVAALAVLLVLTAVYQGTIARWVHPPSIQPVRLPEQALAAPNGSLADLFPESAWQRGDCKRLQTSDGTLLFQHWEQTSGEHWKLWPVTLVVGRGLDRDASSEPIVLDAPEGAEIKFTRSLDVLSGGAPPIDRGRMIGSVEIRRVQGQAASEATSPKANRDASARPDGGHGDSRSGEPPRDQTLHVQTSNVWIDHRRVWTTEAIRMQVGRAELVGRDLTLHLAASAGAATGGSGAASILDRMELIYLDRLTLPLEDGGLWEAQEADQSPKALPAVEDAPARATLSLQCGGRVEYDFALDELTLQDSVSLVHQLPRQQSDRFDCERLRLILRDPADDDLRREQPLDWLADIEASGKPVSVKLPSFDCEVTAEVIRLDAVEGLFDAEGTGGVRIQYGAVEAELPRLSYQFDPKRPRVLGTVDAYGAGRVEIADASLPIRRASWSDGFRVQPLGDVTTSQLDSDFRFWIDGDVRASLTDGGQFQADAIEGDLLPAASDAGDAGDAGLAALVPDWLKATGNVRLDTGALAAQTDLLQLFFVHPSRPAAGADSGRGDSQPRDGDGSAPQPDRSEPSLRQWVAQPQPDAEPVDPVARPRPVIRGDTIAAQLELDGAAVTARDLSVTGSVELVHTVQTGGEMLDAKLSGQQLRLREGGGRDVLQLSSSDRSPARFDLGDGYFVGPLIQIWPSDNLVEINDAGEFQMPTAVLPSGLAGAAAGGEDGAGPSQPGSIQWSRAPRCRWSGSMRFDGRTATLTDGVDITAAMIRDGQTWDMHMTGKRLEVGLQQGVQLGELQTLRQATIQQISLIEGDQPVRVEALRRAGDDVLEARHVLQAPRLTLTPGGGGRVIGEGPGWLRSWSRADGDSPLRPTDRENGSGAGSPRDPNQKTLTGLHLVYHDQFVGRLDSKRLEFRRGVRIGVRPVPTWEDLFDAQRMDALALGHSTLDCDRLRFSSVPRYQTTRPSIVASRQTPWEAEATGGVVFRTRRRQGLYEGFASRAAYTSLKGLFTVEGEPARAAVFRQTKPNGDPGPELTVKSLTLRPETMEIQNMQLQQLSIGTLPGDGRSRSFGSPRSATR